MTKRYVFGMVVAGMFEVVPKPSGTFLILR